MQLNVILFFVSPSNGNGQMYSSNYKQGPNNCQNCNGKDKDSRLVTSHSYSQQMNHFNHAAKEQHQCCPSGHGSGAGGNMSVGRHRLHNNNACAIL